MADMLAPCSYKRCMSSLAAIVRSFNARKGRDAPAGPSLRKSGGEGAGEMGPGTQTLRRADRTSDATHAQEHSGTIYTKSKC
jgi:hypothetical protein